MFEIKLINKGEKEVFREMFDKYLLELYNYDKHINFDENGKPIYKYFNLYWEEKDRYPIGLYINNQLAGFMLLREKSQNLLEIAEFYIAPQFRKNGNGKSFFNEILATTSKKLYFFTKKTNIIAKKFWDCVVKGQYFWNGEKVEDFAWLVSKSPIISHDLSINEEYFEKIRRGEKIYEGRLLDERRRNFNEGDIIKFISGEKFFYALIEERKLFKNFEEMAETIDKAELGFNEKSKEEMIKTYRSFYTMEDEFKYGVVIFKVFLL